MYLVDSGSSDKRAQISRRRLLNDERLGEAEVGCNDIDNSLYKSKHNCTEIRSRKSFRKLLRRGISKRNVAGIISSEEGDNKSTKAAVNAEKEEPSSKDGFNQSITGAISIFPFAMRSSKYSLSFDTARSCRSFFIVRS